MFCLCFSGVLASLSRTNRASAGSQPTSTHVIPSSSRLGPFREPAHQMWKRSADHTHRCTGHPLLTSVAVSQCVPALADGVTWTILKVVPDDIRCSASVIGAALSDVWCPWHVRSLCAVEGTLFLFILPVIFYNLILYLTLAGCAQLEGPLNGEACKLPLSYLS